MGFRSQMSQRIVAVGLWEGRDGKLKCSKLRVGRKKISTWDYEGVAVLTM